ncbi:ubiquinone biosynthesis protein Coq4 [Novosphingobium sp. PhB165]|uniref:Coq4 family protein n=1 Tax=Novosphingobium sp. PhB165 TaxID=2485105 RepID=UPI0010508553|nr:Coq4 family protein [Novosphingobium sp. PhB165]TCM14689.1 ubiquinone biosynthesis protein Coq4 [Novosphingobium sp. PhB165]
MNEATIGDADRAYFNGAIKAITTQSSVLVSSSRYLNHAPLRALIAQEMLRRNGPDLPNTAYIPEVAQIFHELEDMPRIIQLFEMEKARLPEFRRWLEEKRLADFTIAELEHCAPGTLGAAIRDFMVNSGYQLDLFFQEVQVVNDFTYYLRQTALTHDIEHMVTGFGPNHGGEIALLTANMHAKARYFHPELSAFFSRIAFYLKAKTILKDGLHYPEAMVVNLEAEFRGAEQGRNWTMPLMLVDWRARVDQQIVDIRRELGITPAEEGLWLDTNRLCNEDDPDYQPTLQAAE